MRFCYGMQGLSATGSGYGLAFHRSRAGSACLPQNRHCARVERKVHAESEVEAEPTHGQRPERMAVTETDCPIHARFADTSNHSVEPGGNLLGRLPTGNLTVPDGPARNRLPDLRAGLALIVTVEPFGEVIVDLRFVRADEPSQLRGLTGSPPRDC